MVGMNLWVHIALTSSSNVVEQEIFNIPRCFSFICKLALTLATSNDMPEKYLLFFEMPRSLERPKNSISAEDQAKFTPTHRGHNIHEQWSIFPSSIHRLQLVEYVIVAILYRHPFLEDGTKTLIAINHSRPTFLSKAGKHKH